LEETIVVVGLVRDELRDFILDQWKTVEEKYDSKAVWTLGHPHVSFQGGHTSDMDGLERLLEQACSRLEPFEVITDGFGFFDRPSNVAFVKVVKTDELLKVNKEINEALKQNCRMVFKYYTPDMWVPHITIALDDISDEDFQQLKNSLEGLHPVYRQVLSELHLIRKAGQDQWEIVRSFKINSK